VPLLLRLSNNKRRWDWTPTDPPWLPADDVPGAPFGDLVPSTTSELSMWIVEDGDSNLHRIVAALAAGRKHLDKFDYLLIERQTLVDLGLVIEPREELCPDPDASTRWHCNVLRFSASRLTALVRVIHSSGRKERLQKPQVQRILDAALTAGHIDRSRLEQSLLDDLASQKAP
jgi:hypothetical protein